jgi:hypothetical protein
MSLFIDAFTRALTDALAGYHEFEGRVRPALEEQAFIRGERKRVAGERAASEASAQVEELERLYGGPQGAFQAKGDEYLALRRAARRIVPGIKDVPETTRTQTETITYPGQGGFQDVTTPVTYQPGGRAPAGGTAGAIADVLRERTRQGPTAFEAEIPGLSAVSRGEQVLAQGEPLPIPEGEPEIRRAITETPTGRTVRRLDLPEGPEEPMVPTAAGPIPISLLHKWGGPEAVRNVLGIQDPLARARLAFDVGKAAADYSLRRAEDATRRYLHDTPSAAAQMTAKLTRIRDENTRLYQASLLEIQRGNAQALAAYRAKQIELEIATLALRRQALAQRTAAGGQITRAQALAAYREFGEDLDRFQEQLASLRQDRSPDAERTRRTLQIQIEMTTRERDRLRTVLTSGGGAPGGAGAGPSAPAAAPSLLSPGAVPPALRYPAPAGPAPVAPTVAPRAAPTGGAAVPRPDQPGRVPFRPARREQRADGTIIYHTHGSGPMTSAQIFQIIRQSGLSDEELRQALTENGIDPAEFGF